MEINGSTFLLEILNFLVLVWILKRFLYQPVLDTVARRRAAIEQELAAARAAQAEAQALQGQYESRLGQWGAEREAAREALRREIAEERRRLLADVEQEFAHQREKARVLEEKLRADALGKYQEQALAQGARFAARLLAGLAGPELERRLLDLALAQLDALPAARLDAIRLACQAAAEAEVATAYPLDAPRRRLLAQKLGEVAGVALACRYAEDAGLLAGLRVTLGPWVFQANLRDELASFAAAAHDAD